MSTGPYSILLRRFLEFKVPLPASHARLHNPILIILTIGLGLAVALLPLRITILLIGGSIFSTLVLIRPVLALYSLIPIIPFSSLFAIETGGFTLGLMEAMLASGMLAWLLKLLACPKQGQAVKIKTGPLIWPFLLFFGGIGLSWLNTHSISASLVETAKWVEVFIVYLFVINLWPIRHIKWGILLLILTGLAQALLGLYQFIFKAGPAGFLLFDGRFLRAYGTFAQPNPYGGYLGLVLPLALALTLWALKGQPCPVTNSADHAHWAPHRMHPAQIWPGFVATGNGGCWLMLRVIGFAIPLIILLAALFASQSRGAWLGFAIAALVVLIAQSKKSATLIFSLALAGMLVGLIGSFDPGLGQTGASETASAYRIVIQRFADAIQIMTISDLATIPVTDANFATLERLAHWQAAEDMWRDNLWLGVGFGNYAVVYPAYAIGRWLDPLGHAHNYLLNIGAEAGLMGITVYLIFWIFTFGLLWAAVRRSYGFYKAVALGGLGVMVHLHIHNLVDNLYVQGMYLHIAIILGLVSIIYEQYQCPSTSRIREIAISKRKYPQFVSK
jgi:O-antigen ligase